MVLEALDHADAADAADALAALAPDSYRPFNLLVADSRDAFWLAHRGDGQSVAVASIEDGVSMLTAHDLNDTGSSDRVRRYLSRFRAAPAPDPSNDDWTAWSMLTGSGDHEEGAGPSGAMSFLMESGFDWKFVACGTPRTGTRSTHVQVCKRSAGSDALCRRGHELNVP